MRKIGKLENIHLLHLLLIQGSSSIRNVLLKAERKAGVCLQYQMKGIHPNVDTVDTRFIQYSKCSAQSREKSWCLSSIPDERNPSECRHCQYSGLSRKSSIPDERNPWCLSSIPDERILKTIHRVCLIYRMKGIHPNVNTVDTRFIRYSKCSTKGIHPNVDTVDTRFIWC